MPYLFARNLHDCRFWKLIDETEKLVNFGIAAFKTGQKLSNLTTALMRLGVGRSTILQYVDLIRDPVARRNS